MNRLRVALAVAALVLCVLYPDLAFASWGGGAR